MATSGKFIPLAGPRGPIDLGYIIDPTSGGEKVPPTTKDKIRECEKSICKCEEQIGYLMVELEKLRNDQARLRRVAVLEAELERIQKGGEVSPPPSLPLSPIPEDSGEWCLGASRDEETRSKRTYDESVDEESGAKRTRGDEESGAKGDQKDLLVKIYRLDFVTPSGLPGKYCTDIIKVDPEFDRNGKRLLFRDRYNGRVVGFGYDRNSPDKSRSFWDRLRRDGMGSAKYLHIRQTDVMIKHEGVWIPRIICLARDNSHDAQYAVWGQVVYSHEDRRGVSPLFDAFPSRRQSMRYFKH